MDSASSGTSFPLYSQLCDHLSRHGQDVWRKSRQAHFLDCQLMMNQDAVTSLNTLQSNFAIVDAIRKSGRKMNDQAIPEMIEWCNKIGYQVCYH